MTTITKILSIIFFSFLLNQNFSYSQNKENKSQDSTWNLYDLNPDNYTEEPFTEKNNFISYGWFPKPYTDVLSYSLFMLRGDIFDFTNGINSAAFVNNNLPYYGSNDLSNDDRKIKKRILQDFESSYPATFYFSFGFDFKYYKSILKYLRSNASLIFQDGMLFAEDNSKMYIDAGGLKHSFKEVGIIYLSEILVNGGIGFDIPFYGVFMMQDKNILSSTYNLYLGISDSYSIYSNGTEYKQIANAKNELMYRNGIDTFQFQSKTVLKNLLRNRTYFDVALGINFEAEFLATRADLFLSVPLNSVLSDADWRQYIFGIRLSLSYLSR